MAKANMFYLQSIDVTTFYRYTGRPKGDRRKCFYAQSYY